MEAPCVSGSWTDAAKHPSYLISVAVWFGSRNNAVSGLGPGPMKRDPEYSVVYVGIKPKETCDIAQVVW